MPESPLEVVATAAVCLVLALWLVLTVLNQFDRTRGWILPILRYDFGSAVPIWTFFAPNPGRTDTHVVYRDIYEAGPAPSGGR